MKNRLARRIPVISKPGYCLCDMSRVRRGEKCPVCGCIDGGKLKDKFRDFRQNNYLGD